jgi:hypothetical protein
MPMNVHGDNDEDGGDDDVDVHDDGESGASNSTHWTIQTPPVKYRATTIHPSYKF